jgi:hypothetical protein
MKGGFFIMLQKLSESATGALLALLVSDYSKSFRRL